jgi:predicted nuclease of predicted toxin-antitoxin system
MVWSGKIVLEPFKPPRYLLDNDLAPGIATSLRLFNYDILHVNEVDELSPASGDLEIFKWCKKNGRTWITHDIEAKTKHATSLKTNRISVLWIRGHTEQNANWFFFKIIVRELDKFHEKLLNAHGAIHYRATRTDLSYIWAESPLDKQKGNSNI